MRQGDESSPASGGTSADDVARIAREVIGDRRFIVVSNREPIEHVRVGSAVRERRTIGGLTSALEPMMEAVGGTWVAWGSGDADRDVVDARDGIGVPTADPAYRLRRVWLTDDQVQKFYAGHGNQMLWPLFHLQPDKARFLRAEWEVYQSVNHLFVDAVLQELDGSPGVVWFQDYHFASAPAMLRAQRPDVRILQFWHIPWPPWEVFRQYPRRAELLRGLLGCDLIGMQVEAHGEHFLDCVQNELSLPIDRERGLVLLEGRTVRVTALPISIDANHIDSLSRAQKTQTLVDRQRKQYVPNGGVLGIGVERADYTKGIILRLRAIDHFLATYPSWQRRFTFVQVSTVSRQDIPAYALYQQSIQRIILDINRRYGTPEWKPIVHIRTSQGLAELVAFFRLAQVAIVSSRQDGMNLVAKEFIASRSDDKGVLVLSEFAGASGEMHQALVINPYDIEAFADAIHRALTMEEKEQSSRMHALRDHLFSSTVYDWLSDILREIAVLDGRGHTSGPIPLLDTLNDLQAQIARAKKVELFCDYDGVLTPIAPRPSEAHLDQAQRDLLIKLRDSENVHVSIVSGRALSDLTELVRIERLTYAGNHGLEISGPRFRRFHPDAKPLHALVRTLYDAVRAEMRDFSDVIVEDKHCGICVHYRLARQEDIPAIIDRVSRLVTKHDPEHLLRITTGKCLIEVRPNIVWDKGKAVLWMLEALHGSAWRDRVVFYLGDDVTDEDAFRALGSRAVTIFVGDPSQRKTSARYCLPDTSAVATFLEWLTHVTH